MTYQIRRPHRASRRKCVVMAMAAAVCAACVTEPKMPVPPPIDTKLPPPVAPPPVLAPAPPQPVQPTDRPSLDAKSRSQKLTLDAIELLQNGEEALARKMLEDALRLDSVNELARKMIQQLNADAQRELGPQYFRYTVQSGDSLAEIARRLLGDRYLFYLLAKYNDIKVPNRLQVGQVIKLPGKQPPSGSVAPPPKLGARGTEPAHTGSPRNDVEVVAPPPKPPPLAEERDPRSDADKLLAQGDALQRNGDLEGAFRSFNEAYRRDPRNADALRLSDVTKRQLIAKYHRDAASAFSKQDLDGAIQRWGKILDLDPHDKLAELKRAQAIDLKKRVEELGKQ